MGESDTHRDGMMDENSKKRQTEMHKDFFDRANAAVESRYYLEAVFLEYAAIEGRLEVIMGILGFPCNKKIDPDIRRRINISNRIECLRVFFKCNQKVFERSKLPKNFFASKGQLKSWINKRNAFVHGLLKNADEYSARNKNSHIIAVRGLEYSRLLYNEAKRLNRLVKSHPELFEQAARDCQNCNCVAVKNCTENS